MIKLENNYQVEHSKRRSFINFFTNLNEYKRGEKLAKVIIPVYFCEKLDREITGTA